MREAGIWEAKSGIISNDNYLSFLSAYKNDTNFIANQIVISAESLLPKP